MVNKILWLIYSVFVISDLWIAYPRPLRMMVHLAALAATAGWIVRLSKQKK